MTTVVIANVERQDKLIRECIATNSNTISLCYVYRKSSVPPGIWQHRAMGGVTPGGGRPSQPSRRPMKGAQLPITVLSNRFTLRRIHKYQKNHGATLFGESMKFPNHNTNIIN